MPGPDLRNLPVRQSRSRPPQPAAVPEGVSPLTWLFWGAMGLHLVVLLAILANAPGSYRDPAVLTAMVKGGGWRAMSATDALGRMGKNGLEPLVELMRDPDANVRRRAIRGLSDLGADAEAAVPVLIEALESAAPRPQSPVLREAPDDRAGIAFSYTGIGFFFTWCYYRRLLGPRSK